MNKNISLEEAIKLIDRVKTWDYHSEIDPVGHAYIGIVGPIGKDEDLLSVSIGTSLLLSRPYICIRSNLEIYTIKLFFQRTRFGRPKIISQKYKEVDAKYKQIREAEESAKVKRAFDNYEGV
ncbi:MAG: hypothetical protein WC916_03210 [Candidatus Woesearchaeota archaeon]